MADETIDVLVGGYLSKDAARDDYQSLRMCAGCVHGATLVAKDLRGRLSVEQTDHIVRAGAARAAKVGFVLGLVVPPLIVMSTMFAAAVGAGIGEVLHRLTASELKKRAGATIPIGGAGLIVAYPKSSADFVTRATERAITSVIGEAHGHGVKALRSALTDAQQKMAAAAT